jgi:N-(2-amino-2-carboxyethyl)-L-glutamate synthase
MPPTGDLGVQVRNADNGAAGIPSSVESLGGAVARFGERTADAIPTPMATLTTTIAGRARRVQLKLEGCNPSGSVKYRTARHLVAGLERSGALTKGSTLVESTSGNLGIALAALAAERGYRFLAVVDPKTTAEALDALRAAGAEIEMVTRRDSAEGYLLTRLERVGELLARSPSYVWTNQYENAANPQAHFFETGPEIHEATGGAVDAVFVAVSTGGTLAGISSYFRSVGVDVCGSVVFGDAPRTRWLSGIGSSRRSSFLEPRLVDGQLIVDEADAVAWCRAVAAHAGLDLGGSSGAVLAGCASYLASHPDVTDVVCLCADFGTRYRSTIYNDEWLTTTLGATRVEVPPFEVAW